MSTLSLGVQVHHAVVDVAGSLLVHSPHQGVSRRQGEVSPGRPAELLARVAREGVVDQIPDQLLHELVQVELPAGFKVVGSPGVDHHLLPGAEIEPCGPIIRLDQELR